MCVCDRLTDCPAYQTVNLPNIWPGKEIHLAEVNTHALYLLIQALLFCHLRILTGVVTISHLLYFYLEVHWESMCFFFSPILYDHPLLKRSGQCEEKLSRQIRLSVAEFLWPEQMDLAMVLGTIFILLHHFPLVNQSTKGNWGNHIQASLQNKTVWHEIKCCDINFEKTIQNVVLYFSCLFRSGEGAEDRIRSLI